MMLIEGGRREGKNEKGRKRREGGKKERNRRRRKSKCFGLRIRCFRSRPDSASSMSSWANDFWVLTSSFANGNVYGISISCALFEIGAT